MNIEAISRQSGERCAKCLRSYRVIYMRGGSVAWCSCPGERKTVIELLTRALYPPPPSSGVIEIARLRASSAKKN